MKDKNIKVIKDVDNTNRFCDSCPNELKNCICDKNGDSNHKENIKNNKKDRKKK